MNLHAVPRSVRRYGTCSSPPVPHVDPPVHGTQPLAYLLFRQLWVARSDQITRALNPASSLGSDSLRIPEDIGGVDLLLYSEQPAIQIGAVIELVSYLRA